VTVTAFAAVLGLWFRSVITYVADVVLPADAPDGVVVALSAVSAPALVLVLFDVTVDSSALASVALFEYVVAEPGRTRTRSVPLAPDATVPRFHVTVPPVLLPPLSALMKVRPAGRTSVTTTPVALAVPLFA
jgi:hypothetical protein